MLAVHAVWGGRFAARRCAAILAALGTMASLMAPAPAAAQGLFDFLFSRRSAPPAYSNYYSHSYADPRGYYDRRAYDRGYFEDPEDRAAGESGPHATYCVRLCDGRYFPIPRGNASATQTCNAFCPAAKTKVFSGGGIGHAVANDGTRYTSLENAFVYREKLVPDCSCNGKDAVGLAPVDVNSDPTLRAGDIVATTDGLMAYRAKRGQQAEFTPVDPARLTKNWRDTLSNLKIEPQPEAPPNDALTPQDARKAERTSRNALQR